ncbi:MAG: hypothetical protein JEY96_08945 [Bacteroidales bacterium]|nr:hypothetical protein [Bacteroidales bacterium]
MRDLKKLEGAKMLSKTEQRTINGGKAYPCETDEDCPGVLVCAPAGVCWDPTPHA